MPIGDRRGAFDMHVGKKQMRCCVDCPTMIPHQGGKQRCAPCAERRYRAQQNGYKRAKTKKAKMAARVTAGSAAEMSRTP